MTGRGWCLWCGNSVAGGAFCNRNCWRTYRADLDAERTRLGVASRLVSKRGPRRNEVDLQTIDAVVELRRVGLKFCEISERLEISRDKVAGIVRREKVA